MTEIDQEILVAMMAAAWPNKDAIDVATAAKLATYARAEAVDRIRRQWADERRVYLALADDVRLVDVKEDDELDDDVDYGVVWNRIGRRLDAIAQFEAGEEPGDSDEEAGLPA